MRDVVFVKRQSASFADVLASVGKTASARVCNFVSAHGTLVTGYVYNLNDVFVIIFSAHCKLYSLLQNCTFLVYTATHCGGVSRHNDFGYFKHIFKQGITPRLTRNLTKHFIF